MIEVYCHPVGAGAAFDELQEKDSRLGVGGLRDSDGAPQGRPVALGGTVAADLRKAGRAHKHIHKLDFLGKADVDLALAAALLRPLAHQLHHQGWTASVLLEISCGKST